MGRQKVQIFHAGDLSTLWNIQNRNTLYTLLKRYTQRKILFRIYKGLYSLLDPDQIDPRILGLKAIHQYAYVSTETVLAEAGIIPQIVWHTTLVSSRSLKFKIGNHSIISRRLQDRFLFHPAGIFERNGIPTASLERAAADLLYFNPKVDLAGRKLIDFGKVTAIQNQVGFPVRESR